MQESIHDSITHMVENLSRKQLISVELVRPCLKCGCPSRAGRSIGDTNFLKVWYLSYIGSEANAKYFVNTIGTHKNIALY